MANIYVSISGHSKQFDVVNMLLLFWPGSKIYEKRTKGCDVFATSRIMESHGCYRVIAKIRYKKKDYCCQRSIDNNDDENLIKLIKQTLFFAGNKATGVCPPWGILTGIRPMSVYEKLRASYSSDETDKILDREFFLSKQKRLILSTIYDFRKPVYYDGVKEDASLYISIPFCPSKCYYCSFVSSAVEKVQKLIPLYLEQLHKEIAEKIDILYASGKRISTVYIGGGTPGVLNEKQIDDLLSLIRSKLNAPLHELCYELGRPETVTEEKLKILKMHGVDRICINCQTLNDDILEAVGRHHTAQQFIDACAMAQKYGFKSINVDFIAGLPDENVSSHVKSVQKTICLNIENITIHCLSIKKANTWARPDDLFDPTADSVAQMVETDAMLLQKNGYYPYYIYRQKNTVSNGENIGYAKEGCIGKYNIYMMEDVHSVIGCGAGASTKIIHGENGRIDRFVNTKYPQEYLKFPEKLQENIEAIRENLKGNY